MDHLQDVYGNAVRRALNTELNESLVPLQSDPREAS